METYVLRLWLPDRPGALGAVASRVGAVRGDVIGIDILETGEGRAIDELVVRLPREALVGLLISEVEQVDGVDVEFVRPLEAAVHDPRLERLETAAILVGASSTEELCSSLCVHGARVLGAQWVTVIGQSDGTVHHATGGTPSGAWLAAFVRGAQAAEAARIGAVQADLASDAEAQGSNSAQAVQGGDDVAWAPMPAAGMAIVVGRSQSPFRSRERRQLSAVARIADTRFREFGDLSELRSRMDHPAGSSL